MKKILLMFCTIVMGILLSVSFCTGSQTGSHAMAAAKGVVNTDSLNVRTGAGTGFSMLNIGGNDVKLSRGTSVNILDSSAGGWYKVSFLYGKETAEGYVASMYIAQSTDKSVLAQNLSISAKMLSKQKISSKASAKASAVTYSGKVVKLKKGYAVTVTQVKKKSGKIWYQILFTYKGKQMSGYILASKVQIKKGLYKASTLKKSPVYKSASTKKAYKLKKKAVTLKKGKSIKVIKEKTVKNKKWYYIRFALNGKSIKAWTRSDNVMFTSGKVPAATKAPVVPTPAPTTPVALSDAEFEAAMTTQNFPESYKVYLRQLHASYPYWQFKAYNTGIDWNTAVKAETKQGVSIIPNSKTASWKSSEEGAYDYVNDKYVIFDGKTWVCASEQAVAYYMDPRNFLNSKNAFMFETLTYQPSYQTGEKVEKVLNGTLYSGSSYTYSDNGTVLSKTYAATFIEAALINNISPIHLASRMRQEVVTGAKTVSNSVTGTVAGYEGIYNFYNIGAFDSTTGQAVINGLKFASTGTTYMRPWNNPYKSIVGGAQYIAGNYVKRGQDTLYLERFNVTPNSTYNHQYMTNVEAAYSESLKIYTAYSDWLSQTPYVFCIPVYNNMPDTAVAAPSGNLNPNNYLKSLTVRGSQTGTEYQAVTPFNVSDGGKTALVYNIPATEGSISIDGIPVNINAVINGTGTVSLSASPLTVNILVTAQNGAVRNYVLTINII